MKKLISILLCVVMVCALAGCGAGKGENEVATRNAEELNEADVLSEMLAEKEQVKYDFSGIEGLGNDPQNLRIHEATPAFDDEYIYFYDSEKNSIYKVDYNGQNLQKVGYESNYPKYLNVADGYIYYAIEKMNEHVNHKLQFYRMDIATGESTLLFEEDLGSVSFEIEAMLLYKDLLIAVCTSGKYKNSAGGWSGRDFTKAVAYDVKTGECYTIMATVMNADEASITVDNNDNVYLFVEQKSITDNNITWVGKTTLDEIRQGLMLVAELSFNLDKKDILYPGGLLTTGKSFFMRYNYEDMAVDEYDCSWTRDDETISYDEAEEYLDIVRGETYTYTARYMLSDSLLVYKQSIPAEIYLVKDLDFSSIDLVYTTRFTEENKYQYSSLGFGVHDDKFYYFEKDYDTANYLTVIDSEGNINEYTLN